MQQVRSTAQHMKTEYLFSQRCVNLSCNAQLQLLVRLQKQHLQLRGLTAIFAVAVLCSHVSIV
jgi:hypothetical protein